MSETMISSLGQQAREGAQTLVSVDTSIINNVLATISEQLIEQQQNIIEINGQDIEAAIAAGKSDAFIDRLTLTPDRIKALSESLQTIISLPDPLGEIISEVTPPNNLLIRKVRVPIGVIGMIYESRPNVTIDAAALCLKSHNAVILRGGSECLSTNQALHNIISEALEQHELPEGCVGFVASSDRSLVDEMLQASNYIDILIPRGGRTLTEKVSTDARMPVFAHLDGICHIYVHNSAKPDLAREVIVNAKMRRTGICGAAETLLLDEALPQPFKKDLLNQLIKAGCEIRGDEELCNLDNRLIKATENDWRTEYLGPIISAKVVKDTEDAINHINTYGSHHTDSIIAEDPKTVDLFLTKVDSGIVMHNTSTQYADGGEFGMGAEIGIATGKLHARGPVALEQLTTYKYHVLGEGQIRP